MNAVKRGHLGDRGFFHADLSLAYSRYLRDKPDQSGMKCISAWYAKADSVDKIWQWFARHPDKPAGVLLHVLIKKECGE